MKKKRKEQVNPIPVTVKVYGDPVYSAPDDIFARAKKVTLDKAGLDGDNRISPYKRSGVEDLDVPGAEPDDAEEVTAEGD